MAHAHHHHDDLVPPKDFKVPPIFLKIGIGLTLLGVVFFLIGLAVSPTRAWRGYLIGHWFALSLGLAGPFFIATQYLAKAGWSVSLRRIPEAMGTYLYAVVPLSLLALLGAPTLFKWLHPEHIDPIIAEKTGFLNMTGLVIVTVIAPITWAVFHFLLRKNSIAQDDSGDASLTRRNLWLSAGFILLFVLGYSFMSWYWLMSLDAHWFSTMWQVYTFAGMFQSGLAVIALLLIVLIPRGVFGSVVGTQQLHDVGKLVFAFTVFYAYIGFSQFLLIWYANIPEETIWYYKRLEHGWAAFTLLLPFVKFIIPFLLLLPQDHKKNKNNVLWYVCWLILAAQLFEVWYWVMPYPAVSPGQYGPLLPWLELPIALGFIGLFIVLAGRALSSAPLVPLKDPFLHESIPHSHTNLGSSQADLEAQVDNVVREH